MAACAELAGKLALVRNELLNLLERAAVANATEASSDGGGGGGEEVPREFASDDDVTLTYLTSIAEDLSTSFGDPEDLDEEAFAETICAYVPPLSELDSATLKEWIVGVARKLDGVTTVASSLHLQQSQPAVLTHATSEPEVRSSACGLELDKAPGEVCSTVDGKRSECEQEEPEAVDERVALLMEMFGGMCSLTDVQKCLQQAGGDVDRAVQELLDYSNNEDEISRAESAGICCGSMAGAGISPETCAGLMTNRGREDRALKTSILSRYGYVASDGGGGSTSQHCPKPIATEEKKLIRYRDGQVVSTKGERYMEVKKQETEEMKKTYISLKPLKKYRWH